MIIFSTIGGTTRKVARRVADRIGEDVIVDARTAMSLPTNNNTRHVLLFCPAYGDAEAENDFEDLLLNYNWATLAGTAFAFCELGIYTGYEDFGHGLAGMVRQTLVRHGMHEVAPALSIDAVPITDWQMIDAWSDLVARRLTTSA